MTEDLKNKLIKAVHIAYETRMLFRPIDDICAFEDITPIRKQHYQEFALAVAKELLSIEPTEEMLEAGAKLSGEVGMRHSSVMDLIKRDYKAMTQYLLDELSK